MKSVLIVGGTGVQGRTIASQLSKDGHQITVLTRNKNSGPAQDTAAIPNVTLVEAGASWQDENSFLEAAKKADVVYVNTDGGAGGPIIETYWGIRLYELARHAKVKHFIYSSLDYSAQYADYDPKFNCGHLAAKARVVEFLKSQPTQPMNWTATITGPYIEMLWDILRPRLDEGGKTTFFEMPLSDGQIPFIHLEDFARYVSWIVDHPEEAKGQCLDFATVNASGNDIAMAFQNVSGKPAKYVDIPNEIWSTTAWAHLPDGANTKFGALGVKDQSILPQTFEEDFAAFWHLWSQNKGPNRSCPRDFDRMDNILPDRIRTVEDWMKKVEYTGQLKPQLNSVRRQVGV